MDRDTDLFVQAFWVKCRDVIRPELDRVIDELKSTGHDANVSTQEYSAVADRLPDMGPVLTLTVHPLGAPEGRTLQFHGDVAKGNLEIIGSGARRRIATSSPASTRRSPSARSPTGWRWRSTIIPDRSEREPWPTPSTTYSAVSARPSTRPMSRRSPPA